MTCGEWWRHAVVVTTVLVAIGSFAEGQSPQTPPVNSKDTFVYIGSQGDKGKGIHVFRLQSAGSEVFQNVTLVPLGLAVEAANATSFELDSKRRRLFAVNETDEYEGKRSGAVSAYAIDPAGKLTLINQRSSLGTRPCQLALDRDAQHLFVANCGAGSIAVFPIGVDGQIGAATDTEQIADASTLSIALDPGNRFAFVANAKSDTVATYSVDAASGALTATASGRMSLKAGAGPRGMTFRPDGRFAYLLNSTSSTITTFAYDDATGALTEAQTVTTVPEYFDGANTAGEIQMHRTGKWLYASNVGHNSVVLFSIDFEQGTLTFVEEQGTGGKTPLHFGIEPSAKHLAIANTDSDSVLASRIDEGNGRLKPSGVFASVPSPASIRFLPPAAASMSK